jgi:hypothetical protein
MSEKHKKFFYEKNNSDFCTILFLLPFKCLLWKFRIKNEKSNSLACILLLEIFVHR